LLDVAIDDQEHTHEWLRAGDVLAAVTGDSQPVQGCDSIALGKLKYCAVASPAYVRRYFPGGVTPAALAKAPSLRFNLKDRLQAQWVRTLYKRDIDLPCHWMPSTQCFIDACRAGIAWGMNPRALVASHLHDGSLVELVPGRLLSVPLYWQHTRLQMPMLKRLTEKVISASRAALRLKTTAAD
jgi:LysR family transcriptional regulator (chromosome initiation inhibitor)